MKEGIKSHLEGVLAQGAKTGEEFFNIQRRKAKNEEEASISQNDLDNIKHRIITFIKDRINDVNWYDPSAINKFCDDLDAVLVKSSKRFIKAHNRIEEGSGKEQWDALTKWLKRIRNKTKNEMLAEINRLEHATAPAMARPTERPPKKEMPPLTLEQQRDRAFIEPFITYARDHGAPEGLVQALAMYTVKLNARFTDEEKRSGEEAKAVNKAQELLKTVVDLIAKLAQERDDAEELARLTDDEKTSLINELRPQIAQLHTALESANAKIAAHEQEQKEESSAFTEMRDRVNAKEAANETEIARLKALLTEAQTANERLTAATTELEQRLAKAETSIKENAGREQANSKTATKNSEAVQRHLALFENQSIRLTGQAQTLTAWLERTKIEKGKAILKKLGPARNRLAKSIHQAIEAHIDGVVYRIETVELAQRETELRRLDDIRKYLALVKDSSQPVSIPTPQFVKFPSPKLASLEDMIDEFLRKSPHDIR